MQSYILLISDAPSEAEKVLETLRSVADGREVRVLFDQAEALQLIEADKTDIVFCQLLTGALSAIFFLNDVWKRNPKSARFLLDTAVEPDTLVRCVLAGHQFLRTPLESATVRQALKRAEQTKEYVRNDRIQSLLSRIRTLPSKPSLYLEVLKEVRSAAPNAMVVAELVEKDIGVSTKLIQLVNSPFYSLNQPISNIKDAVLFLGLETTASMIMSLEALSRFDKIKPLYFSADRVWKHSQQIAELTKQICRLVQANPETTGEAYLAALVHDIGKLAFAENFEQEYQDAVKTAEQQQRPLFQIENELFGATHAEAGAYLLAMWGLPIPIVDAVAKHHDPSGVLGSKFTAAIGLHLAEQLAKSQESVEDIILRYPPELGLREHISALEAMDPNRRKPATALRKIELTPPRPPMGVCSGETRRFAKFLGGMARLFD